MQAIIISQKYNISRNLKKNDEESSSEITDSNDWNENDNDWDWDTPESTVYTEIYKSRTKNTMRQMIG